MGGSVAKIATGILNPIGALTSGLLGIPKKPPTGAGAPTLPAAPEVPSMDTAAKQVDITDEERLRRGKASTLLTSLSGENSSSTGAYLGAGL